MKHSIKIYTVSGSGTPAIYTDPSAWDNHLTRIMEDHLLVSCAGADGEEVIERIAQGDTDNAWRVFTKGIEGEGSSFGNDIPAAEVHTLEIDVPDAPHPYWCLANIRREGDFKNDAEASAWMENHKARFKERLGEQALDIMIDLLFKTGVKLGNIPTTNEEVEGSQPYICSAIKWDEAPDDIATKLRVHVPASVRANPDDNALENYLDDEVTNWSGFCHEGFTFEPET